MDDRLLAKFVCFYKYVLQMSPVGIRCDQLYAKIMLHRKQFLSGRYEFYLSPFYLNIENRDWYVQPFVDVDAKLKSKQVCLKRLPVLVASSLRADLHIPERYIHVEVTSFNGIHLIGRYLFRLSTDRVLDMIARDSEFRVGRTRPKRVSREMLDRYYQIQNEHFDELLTNPQLLFKYKIEIRQYARYLWLRYLRNRFGQLFKCIDERGMNYNPFRRFPSRAHIDTRDRTYWVLPFDLGVYRKLSLTEIHKQFSEFRLTEPVLRAYVKQYLLGFNRSSLIKSADFLELIQKFV